MPTTLRQPSSAFFAEKHAHSKERSGCQLETDRNLPLGCHGWHVFRNAVVDPVGGHDTTGEHELEHSAETATELLGCFGLSVLVIT